MADLKRSLSWGVFAAGVLAATWAMWRRFRGSQYLPAGGLALPVFGGRVTSRFGPRLDPYTREPKNHSGLDIGGLPVGTPVYSPVAGTVTLVHYDGVGQGAVNGNAVHVRDSQGRLWSMLHLSQIEAAVGDRVSPGTQIGRLGSTGRSTGPHLHLQVTELATKRNLDPEQFFPAGTFA